MSLPINLVITVVYIRVLSILNLDRYLSSEHQFWLIYSASYHVSVFLYVKC